MRGSEREQVRTSPHLHEEKRGRGLERVHKSTSAYTRGKERAGARERTDKYKHALREETRVSDAHIHEEKRGCLTAGAAGVFLQEPGATSAADDLLEGKRGLF